MNQSQRGHTCKSQSATLTCGFLLYQCRCRVAAFAREVNPTSRVRPATERKNAVQSLDVRDEMSLDCVHAEGEGEAECESEREKKRRESCRFSPVALMVFGGSVDPMRVAADHTLCLCEGWLTDLIGESPNGAASETVVAARSWSSLVVLKSSAARSRVGSFWTDCFALRC